MNKVGVKTKAAQGGSARQAWTSVRNAAGISGILLLGCAGPPVFRIYSKNGSFTDYEIRHEDLAITIAADEMAAFYESAAGLRLLDHDPGTLGLKSVTVRASRQSTVRARKRPRRGAP